MAIVALLLAVVADNLWLLFASDVLGSTTGPDLPLATALYVGFRARDTRQLGLAIVLGLLTDCFSARPLGYFAFLYGATALVALRVRRYVPPDAFVTHVAASFLCASCTAGLAALVSVITVGAGVGGGFLRALVEALATALVAPVVFGFWDRSRLFRGALGGPGYEFAR